MRRLAIAFLCIALAPAAAQGEDAPGFVIRTEHYELHHCGPRAAAEEAGRVLEAAYGEFRAFFGAEPKLAEDERLTVRFTHDRASFNKAIRADGTQPPGGAGGYYWPGSKTAYLFRQPTIYFTRALLIHEAAHQFHYLARTKNKNPGAGWYTEGVAEHLCWHMWDGETLRLGLIAPVTLKDYPRLAREAIAKPDFDLDRVVRGDVPASRPVGWAIYRYLATGREGKPLKGYTTFAAKADRGTAPGVAFAKAFPRTKQVLAGVRAMLDAAQQPWDHVFNQWEMRAPGRMRGTARVVSVCKVREPVRELSATLEVPAKGRWQGGLLLSFVDSTDYTVSLLSSTGGVIVNRRAGGRWTRLDFTQTEPPKAGGTVAMAARCTEKGVVLEIGGTTIGPLAIPRGSLGLCLDASTLHWRDITYVLRD